MHRNELLLVMLACQLGLVSTDQVELAAHLLGDDGASSLYDLLVQRGHLSEATGKALEALVREVTSSADTAEGSQDPLAIAPSTREAVLRALEAVDGLDTAEAADPEAGGTDPSTLMPRAAKPAKQRKATPLWSTTRLRRGHGDKYDMRGELGRGGVSRVLDAIDTDFGREVAVKMMLPGAQAAGNVDRFLLEGRVAGRLTHPNIIPIYEIGILKDRGTDAPYFTMAKIVGRDLRQLLRAVESDVGDARHRFTLPRLLAIFLDVCNAVAYAHDQGVIHRDLKPANVMVGDYGEVFVVDWGLAREVRPLDGRDLVDGPPSNHDRDPAASQEGLVYGTPAYMPPEQADGRHRDVDQRSDVYALGAILYEILTFRPPFDGVSVFNVVSKVLSESPVPPRDKAREVFGGRGDGLKGYPGHVPDALEQICLRAMARRKEERYASAGELGEEIQLYLEGEKNRARATAKVEEGHALAASLGEMDGRIADLEKEVRAGRSRTKPSWPVERKRDLWQREVALAALQDERVRTSTAAKRAFQAALEFDRNSGAARRALADLYWQEYEAAEAGGNRWEMIACENLVREYNDGRFDDLLRGRGTLSLSTRAYPCACLTQGRTVTPDGWGYRGLHPRSGRPLDWNAEDWPFRHWEPAGDEVVLAHGPRCRAEAVDGAEVWLFRYETRDRILVPGCPRDVEGPGAMREGAIPDAALEGLYEAGSPYRPGAGLCLGTTPVRGVTLPMGAYLAVVVHPGKRSVRVPLRVKRLETVALDVTLYGADEVGWDFVQVPAGSFPFQGDRGNPYSQEGVEAHADDVFLARYPVRARDYLAFLNALAAERPEEARTRVPRRAPTSGLYWPVDGEGRYHIPTDSWCDGQPPGLREQAARLEMSTVGWDPDWPVFGVSWEDLMAYGAWLGARSGTPVTLPHEMCWEKAARGPDGRVFPWGESMDGTFANCALSHEGGIRPCPVDSFPADESPYGVRGMGGNAREGCLNGDQSGHEYRICRGGCWAGAELLVRPASRTAFPTSMVNYYYSGRLARPVRLGPAGRPGPAGGGHKMEGPPK